MNAIKKLSLISELSNLLEKLSLFDEILSLFDQLGFNLNTNTQSEQDPENPAEIEKVSNNELIKNYLSGGFNDQDEDNFKETMSDVFEAGLNITNIGSGLISWFESNYS